MKTLVISDGEILGARLLHAIRRAEGRYSSADVVIAPQAIEWDAVRGIARTDLVAVVLPDEIVYGLDLIRRLREACPGQILAVGPGDVGSLILETLRAGADGFLDLSGDLDDQVAALLRKMKLHNSAPEELGRLITVLSASGGNGCSVLTCNLAASLARQRGESILVDFDFNVPALALMMNLVPRHSSADLLRDIEMMDHNLLEKALIPHVSGLRLLAAPEYRGEGGLDGEAVKKLLQAARSASGCVVVDLGSAYPAAATIVESSDCVLLVVRLDITSLRNTQRLLESWKAVGVKLENVRVVANRCGQLNEVEAARIQSALGSKLEFLIPDDPETVNLSVNCGVLAFCESPASKLSKAIRHCSERIGQSLWTPPDKETSPERRLVPRWHAFLPERFRKSLSQATARGGDDQFALGFTP